MLTTSTSQFSIIYACNSLFTYHKIEQILLLINTAISSRRSSFDSLSSAHADPNLIFSQSENQTPTLNAYTLNSLPYIWFRPEKTCYLAASYSKSKGQTLTIFMDLSPWYRSSTRWSSGSLLEMRPLQCRTLQSNINNFKRIPPHCAESQSSERGGNRGQRVPAELVPSGATRIAGRRVEILTARAAGTQRASRKPNSKKSYTQPSQLFKQIN